MKSNNKSKKVKLPPYLKRWYMAAPVALVVLLLLCFLARGWLRTTVVPGFYSLTYGNSINSTLDKEYKALGKPYEILGMPSVKHQKKCTMVYAKGFHLEISCWAQYSSFFNKVNTLKPDLGTRSKTLEANLSRQNWQGGNTSITKLGTSIASGIDWQPDAAYQKTLGKVNCMTDFYTAYSKPDPEAISGIVVCSRDFNLFGKTPADAGFRLD